MNKASKTFTSESLHRNDKNNYSGQIFYNPKTRQNNILGNSQFVYQTKLSNSSYVQTLESTIVGINFPYNSNPLTPNPRKQFSIPQISHSLSHHKENSTLSTQLQQISKGFNKENQRIQNYLYSIRESSVKREKQKSLHILNATLKNSLHKKAGDNMKSSKATQKNNRNLILDLSGNKSKGPLKKKNLHQLMKQQRILICAFKDKLHQNKSQMKLANK